MTRVYFYCRDNQNAYQDDVVVLAEGLRELGVQVFGNCNYWRRSLAPNDWLVRHDPSVSHADCDIVAVSYVWSRWIDKDFRVHESALPEGLFTPGRRYRTVYMDLDDGYLTWGYRTPYRAFDIVLRAKYNNRCFQPANFRPWALGLSGRMTACTARFRPWQERQPDLLINFNASHPYEHPARTIMEAKFTPLASRHFRINRDRDDLSVAPSDPWDRLMWEQTQFRHSREYYERLCRSQAVAAFCGEFIPPGPHAPPYMVGGGRAKLMRAFYQVLSRVDPRPARLIQWDSWRFWESLSAGCLVFNFDLSYFGVDLPVMPESFVHYIAVRPDNVGHVFSRLEREPALAELVASQGRVWALKHYSPVASARRFLDAISA